MPSAKAQGGDPSDLLVVLNPAAGSGRAAGVWQRLLAARPALAAATLVADADPARSAAATAAAIAAPGIRRCVTIGGDGTLHGVVNLLVGSDLGARVALGLVPAGTGSDFARTLGLPKDPLAALDQALRATPHPIDVLRLTVSPRSAGEHTGVHVVTRYVVNIASAGISGLVDQKVNAMPRRSALAFFGATLSALADFRPTPLRVTVDGTLLHEGPAFLAAVANGRYFGKGMKVAPEAVVDDGLADVVVVGDIARWQLPLRLPRIYLGTHLRHPQVRFARGRKVWIEPLATTPRLPPFDVDGEVLASGPVAVDLVAGALRFLS